MIDQSRAILVTIFHLTLLDDNFNELYQLLKSSIHDGVERMYCCQPIPSSTDKTKYIFACNMENDYIDEFILKQPTHIHKVQDKEYGMWVVKLTMSTPGDILALDYEHDMSTSMYIHGDEVYSLCALSDSSHIIQLYKAE